MAFYQIHEGHLSLTVKVGAGASKNELKSPSENAEFLHVKVRAVREKGRANENLVEYLSEIAGIAISKIEITKGHTSPLKIVKIHCTDPRAVLRAILEFQK